MRQKLPPVVMLALTLLLTALPLLAHHSVLAEYNSKKPVTLNGVITRVLWINPHTFWYVDTKDADGTIKHWQVEGPSPAEWHNAKVTRDLAGKPGDNITIEVIVGKTVPDRALGHKFTFPDGHVIQLKMNENGETVASPAR
ncbi:MAG: hypothetical protein DMG30_19595 [Acidobacteria bacterium]|nr:MAG: hypothetical protein DMG30_19595 [Acidobacteriota bacterium]